MPDCKVCKETRQNVDLKKIEPVPYIAHEAEMARLERQHDKERDQLKDTIKKLWIALILVISLLVATNGAWIWYESQFVEESVWQEVDTGEGDAFIAGLGDVNYGESQTESNAPNP